MTQEEFHKRYHYNPNTDCLGEGGFGKVYKAFDTHRDRYVAIKMAEVKPHLEEVRLRKEVETISKLPSHPNIAYYEECYTFSTFAGEYDFGVLQYYELGNLEQLLRAKQLTNEQKDSILRQILQGIEFLHSQGIIHRDLKPQNILVVNRNGEYIPKITDFGISKTLDVNKSSVFTNSLAGAGTLAFASPEQLLGTTIRKNTDLWSFGVLVCWMFTGKLPFNTGNQSVTSEAGRLELFKQITVGDITSIISQLPFVWGNLMKKCIVVDVDKRISGAVKCLEMLNANTEVPIENQKSEKTSINNTIIATETTEAPDNSTSYRSTHLETPKSKPTPIQDENDTPKSHLVRNIIIGVGVIAIVVLSLVYFLYNTDETSEQITAKNLIETPKLVTQNDSLNYALGFANGAGIKDEYLKGDSIEFKITSFLNAIEQSYMGEVTNDNTELGLLGTKIGTTLKEQEKTGLMGTSSLITNFALIKQGLTDGLRGNAVIMSQTESQTYLMETMSKYESVK